MNETRTAQVDDNNADTEARTRFNRFVATIRDQGFDAAILDSADSLKYLTGYSATAVMYQCVIVTSDGDAYGIVREIDAPVFEAVSWITNFVTYVDWDDPVDLVVHSLRNLGLEASTVGQEFGANFLTVRDYSRIREALPTARFSDLGDIVIEMRAIKSEAEIELHRRAGAIADLAMAATVDALAVGVSDFELVATGYQAALQAGADNNAPRLVLLGMGSRSTHFHAGVTGGRLEAGQPVHIELLPQVNGYSSRLMRPAVYGPVPGNLQTTFDRLVEIQDRQFEQLRPGAVAKDVDRVGRNALIDSRLRDVVPNNTGYGLGLISAPKPGDFNHLFTPGSEWELKENMVFHMYLSASGISVSETVRITSEGYEPLTRTNRTFLTKGD
ncbi:M24 family metallopeptidase [Arthrobacter sp. 2RAF6]|uniref:M24 family metallopeptidase n=1 Tax=Arthrobacter sp. 2RAF6 TaxID=3233002 RepID=UPI003F93239B